MARYYDIDAANARLAEVRPLLERLQDDRDRIAEEQAALTRARQSNGSGLHAEEMREREGRIRGLVTAMESAVRQLDAWAIALRDIPTGLIDFPALVSGRPVWLCWRLGEGPIAWWHEFEAGFSRRKPLTELA